MQKSDVKIMGMDYEQILNNRYGIGRWHCDDLWASGELPRCVEKFLDIKRAPASEQLETNIEPSLFANYNGKRVKITMASKFGDLGITSNLEAENGYEERVYIPQLSNFSNHP